MINEFVGEPPSSWHELLERVQATVTALCDGGSSLNGETLDGLIEEAEVILEI